MVTKRNEGRITMEAFNSPLKWGTVTEQHDKIIIMACGPSFRQVDLNLLHSPKLFDAYVIAVNRAIDWTDRADAFFTLDPNEWFYQTVTSRRKEGVQYFAAVPDDYGTSKAVLPSHQNPPLKHVTYLHRVKGGLGRLKAREKLSEKPNSIHTGNSGYGAFGLAYHMRPKKIVILGLDGTQEPYAYGTGKPNTSLDHLRYLFNSAMAQIYRRGIQVINGCPGSTVKCMSILHPTEALEWLAE